MKRLVATVKDCSDCPFAQGEFVYAMPFTCTKLKLTGRWYDLFQVCPLPEVKDD